MLYYGSSEYDSAQMSRLCDLAVEEAKVQGIQPRLTAAERQAAIELWGERFEKHSAKQ
jgi:ABC-type transporter Mla MlaB component